MGREGIRKKAGKGTHGSTTKAGKVRMQTPKIPPSSKKISPCPKVGNRKRFYKRIILGRNIGQVYNEE